MQKKHVGCAKCLLAAKAQKCTIWQVCRLSC